MRDTIHVERVEAVILPVRAAAADVLSRHPTSNRMTISPSVNRCRHRDDDVLARVQCGAEEGSNGRIETRTLKVVTVPAGLGFPHATQAIQVTRSARPIKDRGKAKTTRRQRRETSYAICTLRAAHAQPADLATWIRGLWSIENRLHRVRDVTLGEDLHQARTGSGP